MKYGLIQVEDFSLKIDIWSTSYFIKAHRHEVHSFNHVHILIDVVVSNASKEW